MAGQRRPDHKSLRRSLGRGTRQLALSALAVVVGAQCVGLVFDQSWPAARAVAAGGTSTGSLAPSTLALTLTDGSTTYTAGARIEYIATLTNVGGVDLSNVSVVDDVPSSIQDISWLCVPSGTAACGVVDHGVGDLTLSGASVPLGLGNRLTITLRGRVSSHTLGSLSNSIVASPADSAAGSSTDGSTTGLPGSTSATDVDTPSPISDISIFKTDGATSYVPGAPIEYAITVSNAGPSDARSVAVTDVVPAPILSPSWSCIPDPGAKCGLGTGPLSDTASIPAGRHVTYTVRGVVSQAATGTLVNTATISLPAGHADPDGSNDRSTDSDIAAPFADLNIEKDVDEPRVNQGASAVFRLAVSNAGPSTATGVRITDVLPAGLTVVAATPSQGTCAGTICDLGSMAVGKRVTVRVETSATSPGTLRNTASVTSATADPQLGNNVASRDVQVLPTARTQSLRASLTLRKTGPARATAGTSITYQIRVSVPRSSRSAANGVVVREVLPPGFAIVGAVEGRHVLRGARRGQVRFVLGSIPAGASRTLLVRTRIGRDVIGLSTNAAVALATNAAQVVARATTAISSVKAATIPAVTG